MLFSLGGCKLSQGDFGVVVEVVYPRGCRVTRVEEIWGGEQQKWKWLYKKPIFFIPVLTVT